MLDHRNVKNHTASTDTARTSQGLHRPIDLRREILRRSQPDPRIAEAATQATTALEALSVQASALIGIRAPQSQPLRVMERVFGPKPKPSSLSYLALVLPIAVGLNQNDAALHRAAIGEAGACLPHYLDRSFISAFMSLGSWFKAINGVASADIAIVTGELRDIENHATSLVQALKTISENFARPDTKTISPLAKSFSIAQGFARCVRSTSRALEAASALLEPDINHRRRAVAMPLYEFNSKASELVQWITSLLPPAEALQATRLVAFIEPRSRRTIDRVFLMPAPPASESLHPGRSLQNLGGVIHAVARENRLSRALQALALAREPTTQTSSVRPADATIAYLTLVEEITSRQRNHTIPEAERTRIRLRDQLRAYCQGDPSRAFALLLDLSPYSAATISYARAEISGHRELIRSVVKDLRRGFAPWIPSRSLRETLLLPKAESMALLTFDAEHRRLEGVLHHLRGLPFQPEAVASLLQSQPAILAATPDDLIPLIVSLHEEYRELESLRVCKRLDDTLLTPSVAELGIHNLSLSDLVSQTTASTESLKARKTQAQPPPAAVSASELDALRGELLHDPQTKRFSPDELLAVLSAFVSGSRRFIGEGYTKLARIRSKAEGNYHQPIADFYGIIAFLGNHGVLMKLNDKGMKQVASLVPSSRGISNPALRAAHRYVMKLVGPETREQVLLELWNHLERAHAATNQQGSV